MGNVRRKRTSAKVRAILAEATGEAPQLKEADWDEIERNARDWLAQVIEWRREEELGERKRRRPNRKRLTDTNVTALPVKLRQYLVWDDPRSKDGQNGLAVLVGPSGVRSYRCVSYLQGTTDPIWKHLGRVGEMTLSDAREATQEARRQAKAGVDPRDDDAKRSDAFRAVVEAWIKHEQTGKRGNSSAADTEKLMLKHCADWLARPIATIRPNEIEALLWHIRDGHEGRRATPYMANRIHAHLRSLFTWAARPGGPLKTSPMTGMTKPFANGKSRNREWFKGAAADRAIKAIWAAADQLGGNGARYLKALLLTGKRPWGQAHNNGLGAMRWEHIDGDWFWDAPASQSKNKRLHGVPLSALAQRVLSPRRSEGFVFEPVDADELMKQVRELTGLDDFILHGVRHLVESKTAELGVPPHIRDVLFDHAPARGAGAGYDHHEYKAEMAEAMEAWAVYVEGLVAAEGVARLR